MPKYSTSPSWPKDEALIYNIPMPSKDTEYSQLLPDGTKAFALSIQGGTDTDIFRVAFVEGKVAPPAAPFIQIPGNIEYCEDGLYLNSTTMYLSCTSNNKIAQIIVWR